MSGIEYRPGLEKVPAVESSISFVDGANGILEYRGIPVEVLAEQSSFLEVAYLLIFNRFPRADELARWEADILYHRRIKWNLRDMVKLLPGTGHPMDAIQTLIAATGMSYPIKDIAQYGQERFVYEAAIRLLGKLPTLVATFARMRVGYDPVPPRDDLDHAANFLWMLLEEDPQPEVAKAFDVSLILHAEHTINASTFAGLVTASTLADPYTVVSAAIGALSGPLHGGANERVLGMLGEIGTLENVEPYLLGKLERKEKVWGLGHRVYKVKDPRARVLQNLLESAFEAGGGKDLHYSIAQELERIEETSLGKEKGVWPNVDFYSGILYHKMGIPTDLFTPLFAIARTAGWLAHWYEQMRANVLFRPTQVYTGGHGQPYVPMGQRKHQS